MSRRSENARLNNAGLCSDRRVLLATWQHRSFTNCNPFQLHFLTVVQRLTRFQLTHGVARSLCDSSASYVCIGLCLGERLQIHLQCYKAEWQREYFWKSLFHQNENPVANKREKELLSVPYVSCLKIINKGCRNLAEHKPMYGTSHLSEYLILVAKTVCLSLILLILHLFIWRRFKKALTIVNHLRFQWLSELFLNGMSSRFYHARDAC